jgi:bifunctional DNA-binding transcriptional regulator/antitoxin component of YhaV-PrlF toxin-antitoxin module
MSEGASQETEAYVVTLSAGGQVAIPRFMRKQVKSGERFLIVRVGDGYYLKPVRSLGLKALLDDVRVSLSSAVEAAGLQLRDIDALVADVRKHHGIPRHA